MTGVSQNGGAFAYDWRNPRIWGVANHFSAPEFIETIEVYSAGARQNYMRLRSRSGAEGVVACNNRTRALASVLSELVIPFFIGKDAVQIEQLIQDVYRHGRNYKYAGMALWNAVSFVECAILDMLGRVAQRPVHALFMPQLRSEIPIYQSNLIRDPNLSPDGLLDILEADIAESGARAAKLKIGGRMSRNGDVYPGYSEALIVRARERLGDDMTLYFDANGSYDAANAIRIGRLLESVNAGFFEEPCEWQDYAATREVTRALDMTVAGGEQDTSLAQFADMLDTDIVDLIQPDTMYQGGFIRLLQMAEIARSRGTVITPHSPRNDPTQAYILHFAAICPNLGEYQEHRSNENVLPMSTGVPPARGGTVSVPTGHGWGCEFDDAIFTTVPRLV
ncbi:mandelate racemase/muconate lactonizing enzyme family protein [Aurantiacibacter gangjinensis]|nr:mandelate racemase/muconate lactonizing enzyme family protein [Aurantiacibacter gangjinensis]